MADPRAQFTLTTLLDGSLLAIGGDARYDPRHGVGHPLGSAEILDLAPTHLTIDGRRFCRESARISAGAAAVALKT